MTTTNLKLFAVGGIVRDRLLGIRSKDVDFAVTIDSPDTFDIGTGFALLRDTLVAAGVSIWEERPEFFTIRGQVPKGHPLSRFGSPDVDFVLARKDSATSDGRRPDSVEVGTIVDDLARRDFAINAMARFAGTLRMDGSFSTAMVDEVPLLDFHNGLADLEARRLRFVGDPMTRITEDAVRVLRGLRFEVTKGFTLDAAARAAITSPEAAAMLAKIPDEGREKELSKMLATDTLATLRMFRTLPDATVEAIFAGRLRFRLEPTLKKG